MDIRRAQIPSQFPSLQDGPSPLFGDQFPHLERSWQRQQQDGTFRVLKQTQSHLSPSVLKKEGDGKLPIGLSLNPRE